MCKLFISTGRLTEQQVRAMTATANRLFAWTEADGFGFLAASETGLAWGRYFVPAAFAGFGVDGPHGRAHASEHGSIPSDTHTLIVHGRTATNERGLKNVHPFHEDGEFLAHNGMVTWEGQPGERPRATCDSHQFLLWLKSGRGFGESHIAWSGWGAIAHFDYAAQCLTVARHGASLWVANRDDGGGFLFATKPGHLKDIAAAGGLGISEPREFPTGLARFTSGHVNVKAWAGFRSRAWTALDDLATNGTCKTKAKAPKVGPKNPRRARRLHRPAKLRQGTLFPDWSPRSQSVDESPSSSETVGAGPTPEEIEEVLERWYA